MTELLLSTVLTCQEANLIVAKALLNNTIPTHVVKEVIAEVRLVVPPECVLPVIE